MDVDEFPLIGLNSEFLRVSQAVQNGESLLLLGPAGCGKTKTLRLSLQKTAASLVYVECSAVPHVLLVRLARALFITKHPAFLRLAGAASNQEAWLATQTSARLKGLLWKALEAEPAFLVLDQIQGAGHRTYRFFERLFFREGMAMIAAARDFQGLGMLKKLFWDPRQTVQFSSLQDGEASRLFELAADRYTLRGLNLEEFRDRVLESAQGNPGQIIEMCRLATQPQYLSGRKIKFVPLRIDVMMRFLR
jgi:AAA domain